MSSELISQGLVLATAMAVSSTILFVTFSRHRTLSPTPTHLSGDHHDKHHVLRSCLYSGKSGFFLFSFASSWFVLRSLAVLIWTWLLCLYCLGDKKRERKKKKVQFAENVKEPSSNGEEFRKQYKKQIKAVSCRNEISSGSQGMPPNRIALYNGILKNRVQRMAYSYWSFLNFLFFFIFSF